MGWSRKAWNKRAGANLHSREKRGKHSHSKKWRAGDNWLTCQRCGHDVLASDATEDGYTKGLVVCPTCYDPPHPQDYVRGYQDRISPPSGLVTGETGIEQADGPVGSTTVPGTTFGGNPEVGD